MKRPLVTTAKGFYAYKHGNTQLLNPGAMDFVFQPKFALPEILFRGGARLAGMLGIYQAPQVEAPQLLIDTGVGLVTNPNNFLSSLANNSRMPNIDDPNSYINPEKDKSYNRGYLVSGGVSAINLE